MAEELITEFFDIRSLNAEKDVVLRNLNEVLGVFNRLQAVRISFEGAKTIEDLKKAAKEYEGTTGQLIVTLSNFNQIEQQAIDLEKEKAGAIRGSSQATKDIKNTTESTTKTVKDSVSEYQKVKVLYTDLALLADKYNKAVTQRGQLKDNGGINSGEYTRLTKEIELYDGQLEKTRQAIAALKKELESLPSGDINTSYAKGLQTHITTKESVLEGKDVTTDTTILKQVAELDRLEEKLREIEAEKEKMLQSGDMSNTSSEFIKLSNQADLYRQDIKSITTALGEYSRQVESTKAIGAFSKISAELRQAETNAKDLATQFGADSTQAQEATQKVTSLRRQFEEIKSLLKNGGVVPNTEFKTAEASIDELTNKLKRLRSEYFSYKPEQLSTPEAQQKAGQISTTETSLLDASQQLATLREIIKEQGEVTISIGQTKAMLDQLKKAYEQLGDTVKQSQQGVVFKQQIDEIQAYYEQVKIGSKYEEQLAKEKEQVEQATLRELKEQEKLNSAYQQLNARYVIASNTARNLGVEYGKNSKEFVEAANYANKLHNELLHLDQAVGQSRRNVGNYNGALVNLNQVVRELPNFAINFQTGITSLSNNIPMLADEIGKLTEKNKALKAAGMETVPVWKQIATGLLSWNTAIVVAISLLIQFSKEIRDWVDDLIHGATSLNSVKRQMAQFDEQVKRSTEGLKDYIDHLDRLASIDKVKLEVDNTNIPKLTAMRNELSSLTKDLQTAKEKLSLGLENFNLKVEVQGTADVNFRNLASDKAKEAFDNGTIEADIDKLSEKDKFLYEKLKETTAAYQESSSYVAQLQTQLQVLTNQQQLKIVQIAEQTGEDVRKITLDNTRAITEITKIKNQNILNDDRSSLGQRLAALRSYAAAEKTIIEAEKNSVLNDPRSSEAERNAAIKKALVDRTNVETDYAKKRYDVEEEFRLRDATAQKQYLESQLKVQTDIEKKLSDNQLLSLSERLDAQKQYYENQRIQIEADLKLKLQQSGFSDQEIVEFQKTGKYQIEGKKITNKELLAIQKTYESALLQLSVDTNAAATAILKGEISKQNQIREEDIRYIKSLYDQLETTDTNQYAEGVIALNKALANKTISYSQYKLKRKKLDEQYAEESNKTTVQSLENQLKRFVLYEGDKESLQQKEYEKLREIERKKAELLNATTDEDKANIAESLGLSQAEYDDIVNKIEKLIALEKALANAKIKGSDDATKKQKANADELIRVYGELASAALDFAQALGDGGYERQNNAIQSNMDLLQKRKDKELETVSQSLASQEEKEKQTAKINARAAAQQDALDQQQKRLQVDQARFDKEMAVLKIIAQTAIAVATDNANPLMVWKVPYDIALGAIQVATVVAQPLPRYKEGTEDHEGGSFIAGDGGKHELVIEPSGEMWVTDDKPTLYEAPKHSVVLPELPNVEQLAQMQMLFTFSTTDRILELYQLQSIQNNAIDTEIIIKNNNKNARYIANTISKAVRESRPIIKQGLSNKELLHKYGSKYDKQ